MIKSYETPVNFDVSKNIEGTEVEYSELMEVGQGGPEVGKLSVNKSEIKYEYPFGGPFLIKNGYLYVPVFIRSFFRSGFKLAKIDIRSHDVELIGTTLGLIFLSKIEDGKVYFYEDLDKKKSSYYDLH